MLLEKGEDVGARGELLWDKEHLEEERSSINDQTHVAR